MKSYILLIGLGALVLSSCASNQGRKISHDGQTYAERQVMRFEGYSSH